MHRPESRFRHSCAPDPPSSADRENEGRRDADCTDSRGSSVSRRSFQHPLPRRRWPCSAELPPLLRRPLHRRQPPPTEPAASASAPAFVRTLPYPNSYPRKYGHVQSDSTTKISRFTTSSCGFHGLPGRGWHRAFFYGVELPRTTAPSFPEQLRRFIVPIRVPPLLSLRARISAIPSRTRYLRLFTGHVLSEEIGTCADCRSPVLARRILHLSVP